MFKRSMVLNFQGGIKTLVRGGSLNKSGVRMVMHGIPHALAILKCLRYSRD